MLNASLHHWRPRIAWDRRHGISLRLTLTGDKNYTILIRYNKVVWTLLCRQIGLRRCAYLLCKKLQIYTLTTVAACKFVAIMLRDNHHDNNVDGRYDNTVSRLVPVRIELICVRHNVVSLLIHIIKPTLTASVKLLWKQIIARYRQLLMSIVIWSVF